MALGALATAATFVLVLINQKGTQKQIDSLSQMAEMLFERPGSGWRTAR